MIDFKWDGGWSYVQLDENYQLIVVGVQGNVFSLSQMSVHIVREMLYDII
jgi:hypothetical protein